MIPASRAFGVGVLPWSPLARGILAGNTTGEAGGQTLRAQFDNFPDGRYQHASDGQVIAALQDIATRRGVPPARVALAWVLHQPGVTAPIFGATKVTHVDDAVAALSLELSREDLAALEAPYRPHAIHGHE